MRPLDARGLRIGVVLHAAVVFAAGTSLARGSGVFDAVGVLLLAAATAGYVTARVVRTDVDAAHTAFVSGAVGGLLVSVVFVTGVRADTAAGVYWRVHYTLATIGLPSWLVADYGDAVAIMVGLLLGVLYAFATLAGGGIGAGDLHLFEQSKHPGDRT